MVPELEEVSARAVKMWTEMWSMKVAIEIDDESNNRAKIQPSTPMKVLRIKCTEPKIGEQIVPGLGEGSARAVKMLTVMWSMRESSLADELSRKVIMMRSQDEILTGIDATTVQISTANTQPRLMSTRSTPCWR